MKLLINKFLKSIKIEPIQPLFTYQYNHNKSNVIVPIVLSYSLSINKCNELVNLNPYELSRSHFLASEYDVAIMEPLNCWIDEDLVTFKALRYYEIGFGYGMMTSTVKFYNSYKCGSIKVESNYNYEKKYLCELIHIAKILNKNRFVCIYVRG
jgi:hypothetical protein